MLGFGLPLSLLVVLGWPLLLTAALSDAHFQLKREAAMKAEPRRRRAAPAATFDGARCLMGVLGGSFRRRAAFWQLAVEARRVLLVGVLLALLARPAGVQVYAMWGLLMAMLVAELAVRPGASWPLRALQLLVIGVVQVRWKRSRRGGWQGALGGFAGGRGGGWQGALGWFAGGRGAGQTARHALAPTPPLLPHNSSHPV
jgi:hypothetical protein